MVIDMTTSYMLYYWCYLILSWTVLIFQLL